MTCIKVLRKQNNTAAFLRLVMHTDDSAHCPKDSLIKIPS